MKSWKDYFLKIYDGEFTFEVIVNFTKHQIKRSMERDVPNDLIWQSLQEPEISGVLSLKPQEHAVIRDLSRGISYSVEVYVAGRDICLNIITSLNDVDLRKYSKEKEIIIPKKLM